MKPEQEPSPQDLTREEDVTSLMISSKNEEEWNNNCDKIKAANNKDYPKFWYEKIVLSGLANKVQKSWEKK